jgi:hypothetical protein
LEFFLGEVLRNFTCVQVFQSREALQLDRGKSTIVSAYFVREQRRTFEVGVASFLWKSKFQQLVFNGPFKSQALDRYQVISFCRVHAPRGWQLMQSVSSTIESKTS